MNFPLEKKITIVVRGNTEEDCEDALAEVGRRLDTGSVHGSDYAEDSSFWFDVVEGLAVDPVEIKWVPADVQTLCPGLSDDQAAEALDAVGKYLRDRSIELGWEVLEDLLRSAGFEVGEVE